MALGLHHPKCRLKFASAQPGQNQNDGEARETINYKARAESDGGRQDAGERWTDDASQVELGGGEGDRVGEPVRSDHLPDKPLPSRVVEDGEQPEQDA